MSKRFHESYTDTYVPSGKKLTYGSDRLAYIVEPAIDKERLRPKTREFLNNIAGMSPHKKAALELDRLCNKMVYSIIPSLMERNMIFIEGESHDVAENSRSKFGLDFMSRICATSEQILDINYRIAMEYRHQKDIIDKLENVVYFQFGPYLYAFYEVKFEEDKYSPMSREVPVLHFCFEEQMKQATELIQARNKNKTGFGTLEKALDDNTEMRGNFSYAPSVLYDTSVANRLEFDIGFLRESWSIVPEELKEKLSKYDLKELSLDEGNARELRKFQKEIDEVKEISRHYRPEIIATSTNINRELQKAMVENAILMQSGDREIYVFARESCYVKSILGKIGYPFIYTRPLRTQKIKMCGINEFSAQNILESTIKKAGGL